jgi:hypothetical protein
VRQQIGIGIEVSPQLNRHLGVGVKTGVVVCAIDGTGTHNRGRREVADCDLVADALSKPLRFYGNGAGHPAV